MSLFQLLLRGLIHHRRIHLAVALGVAAGTAVLTGALLVGDSMRGSLRQLTLDRLGRIDDVLVLDRFFRTDLADELAAAPEFQQHFREALPVILMNGSLENPATKAVIRANLIGADKRFWALGADAAASPPPAVPRLESGDLVLNQPVAEKLGVNVGDDVLVRFRRASAIPSESALGRKSDDVLLESRRLTVSAVVPATGPGIFGLHPNQQLPSNAWLNLGVMQNALEQKGRANALLIAGERTAEAPSVAADESLARLLRPQLNDFGLTIQEITVPGSDERYFSLASDRMLLPAAVEEAAERQYTSAGAQSVQVYLANTIAAQEKDAPNPASARRRETPYSTIAALDLAADPPFGPFLDTKGQPIGPIADDEIVLNDWTAEDLDVQPGDMIAVTYFEPESAHGETREKTASFRLKAIARLAGPAANRDLTPELKGVTDEQSMADWDPPFEYHQERVREKDEDYWNEHRATPKAFVNLATGRRLWGSRFGQTTSIRIPARDEMGGSVTNMPDNRSLPVSANDIFTRLDLDPARLGFVFRPVKRQGLSAAAGTTPFNLLFLGFSFFIIAAATMLVALLFRLGVEQRAKEVGVLLASGFRPGRVRRLLAGEGLLVAAIGGLIGAAAGVGYAWLMLVGLRTWWLGAVSTPFLRLHVTPGSLLTGYASGVLISFLAIAWSLWRMRRLPVRRLLAGQANEEQVRPTQAGRFSQIAVWGGLLAAIGLAILAPRLEGEAQAGAFFGAGALLLIAGLSLLTRRLRGGGRGSLVTSGGLPLTRLAARNGARNPGRSALTIGLVASATFLIVAISAFRLDPPDTTRRDSGSGGFSLIAETDPLFHDVNTPAGRSELGFAPADELAMWSTRAVSLRLRSGDDASCLNLFQTMQPRMVGVPQSLVERGGFAWGATAATTDAERTNPWLLLDRDLGADADGRPIVPVVADFNTAAYSLHKGLGSQWQVDGRDGRAITVRLVGMLKNSVFQGDLLLSESAFLRLFPDLAGYRLVLVETPAGESPDAVAAVLRRALGEKGIDVETTAARLEEFMKVQNTYLSTFQSLGGLGLLLGTFGLATVQLRNVLERRGELALLRAAGFRRRQLAGLVSLENALLLIGGLTIGCGSALVAIAPHLFDGGAGIPWLSLAGTLGLVLVAGLLAGLLAVRSTLRAPLLPALRGE